MIFRSTLFLTTVLTLSSAALAQQPALKPTLEKLDAASARFTSAEARVHRDSYNALIKDIDDRQDGNMYLIREKAGATQMGLKTEGRTARIVEYKNGTLRDYIPGPADCYNTVNKSGVDTYLTLGFGGSGTDLARAWEITDLGPDTIAGTKVEKLDLIPRDPNVKANITKVTLWLDLDRDVTLKQIFYSPTGDTNTAVYSNIRLNKPVDTKPFAIKGKPCGK